MAKMYCKHCGAKVSIHSEYCKDCGKAIIHSQEISKNKRCPKCKEIIQQESRTCSNCYLKKTTKSVPRKRIKRTVGFSALILFLVIVIIYFIYIKVSGLIVIAILLGLALIISIYTSRANKFRKEKCSKCNRIIPKECRTCPSCYGNYFSDQIEKKQTQKNIFSKKKMLFRRPWFWIIALVLIAFIYQPIKDQFTIWGADPTMITLAQQSGMSRAGELLFLEADPQLDTDDQMVSDCPELAKALNSNGFIEQGCYDPNSNRIYIRKMPQDLYNLEITTAAYEMLHIVYLKNTDTTSLNQAIESNYSAINDPKLNTQVADFAKTEPGARDIELFSLLGTEYSGLSGSLNNYYAPYFTDIGVNVTYNTQIFNTFKSEESQLSQIQANINSYTAQAKSYENQARIAYANSVSWARVGNAYENNYNYNIYVQDFNAANAAIDAANNAIDQYNRLLVTYNTLVSEFNGTQPVVQIPSTQQIQKQ